uniref:CS domain-containing protein n=1 Tax=Chromera velia CCMP2878 TaxID=1169474 RepID=A0A0G4G1I1_9ALVE|eukprot:Cvel_19765.t1-p1 / transcript=Cvel_19765.t1 / gene=Cvel_19765 / organism=Chromera_velia_CCMP2878 / gene_product=hypothetical protein / transcript_product=hypothetical protein / location=Cvel_scaffold1731:18494-24368(+) / protein_length=502 / sequence_SO=supercontig / SO=protein_coding / is_pseudo=false
MRGSLSRIPLLSGLLLAVSSFRLLLPQTTEWQPNRLFHQQLYVDPQSHTLTFPHRFWQHRPSFSRLYASDSTEDGKEEVDDSKSPSPETALETDSEFFNRTLSDPRLSYLTQELSMEKLAGGRILKKTLKEGDKARGKVSLRDVCSLEYNITCWEDPNHRILSNASLATQFPIVYAIPGEMCNLGQGLRDESGDWILPPYSHLRYRVRLMNFADHQSAYNIPMQEVLKSIPATKEPSLSADQRKEMAKERIYRDIARGRSPFIDDIGANKEKVKEHMKARYGLDDQGRKQHGYTRGFAEAHLKRLEKGGFGNTLAHDTQSIAGCSDRYLWKENAYQIEVLMVLPHFISSPRDIDLTVKNKHISVFAAGEEILEGPLYSEVRPDSVIWALNEAASAVTGQAGKLRLLQTSASSRGTATEGRAVVFGEDVAVEGTDVPQQSDEVASLRAWELSEVVREFRDRMKDRDQVRNAVELMRDWENVPGLQMTIEKREPALWGAFLKNE